MRAFTPEYMQKSVREQTWSERAKLFTNFAIAVPVLILFLTLPFYGVYRVLFTANPLLGVGYTFGGFGVWAVLWRLNGL